MEIPKQKNHKTDVRCPNCLHMMEAINGHILFCRRCDNADVFSIRLVQYEFDKSNLELL